MIVVAFMAASLVTSGARPSVLSTGSKGRAPAALPSRPRLV
jgi:hypothetical protein